MEDVKHEPHASAQPVKPALVDEKKKRIKKREKKALTWDEHAIEEHDMLRGTRMKVSTGTAMSTKTNRGRVRV
jgi:hypothetical protein